MKCTNLDFINTQYTLFALYPFGEVEQELLKLQEKIFTATGFASALALPPVIPLCYLPANLNANAVREVLTTNNTPAAFAFTGINEESGIIHMQTQGEPDWAETIVTLKNKMLLTKRTDNDPGTSCAVLFPIIPGFYLAVNQNASDLKALPPFREITVPVTFHAYQLVMIRIQVHAPLKTWWQNLEWEIFVDVKNRKPKK